MSGQIIGRGNGVWLVRIYLGRGKHGRRQCLNWTIHGTKTNAQAGLTATLRDRDTGGAIGPVAMPLNDYLNNLGRRPQKLGLGSPRTCP